MSADPTAPPARHPRLCALRIGTRALYRHLRERASAEGLVAHRDVAEACESFVAREFDELEAAGLIVDAAPGRSLALWVHAPETLDQADAFAAGLVP
jgi:hypothetical protein